MKMPRILDETEDFAVVCKPPRMHSEPLKDSRGDTMLDWIAARCGGGGGLLHRLDYETQGLMLFAKNQKAQDYLSDLQEQGSFVKEYSAICHKSAFPHPALEKGFIESFFRPFGPGRKRVRPVTAEAYAKHKEIAKDQGGYYRTEIVSIKENGHYAFALRLRRGFRHQIRCHLAWIGCPVLNDPLYAAAFEPGKEPGKECGILSLRSTALFFNDPSNGKPRKYRIEGLRFP